MYLTPSFLLFSLVLGSITLVACLSAEFSFFLSVHQRVDNSGQSGVTPKATGSLASPVEPWPGPHQRVCIVGGSSDSESCFKTPRDQRVCFVFLSTAGSLLILTHQCMGPLMFAHWPQAKLWGPKACSGKGLYKDYREFQGQYSFLMA